MRQRIHQKMRSVPKVNIWGRIHYQLSEKDCQRLALAASGHARYVVNEEFRKLIEEKSRFIPKIWDGIT